MLTTTNFKRYDGIGRLADWVGLNIQVYSLCLSYARLGGNFNPGHVLFSLWAINPIITCVKSAQHAFLLEISGSRCPLILWRRKPSTCLVRMPWSRVLEDCFASWASALSGLNKCQNMKVLHGKARRLFLWYQPLASNIIHPFQLITRFWLFHIHSFLYTLKYRLYLD